MSDRAIVLVATTKGLAIAALVKLYLATTFIQGLVTAVVSAIISGLFLLISTHLIAQKTENKVQDAKVDILKGQEKVKQVVEEKVN